MDRTKQQVQMTDVWGGFGLLNEREKPGYTLTNTPVCVPVSELSAPWLVLRVVFGHEHVLYFMRNLSQSAVLHV
jgi:hypothetical protein